MVKVTHEEMIDGQKFKISINKAHNIASVEFTSVLEPVSSVEIDEHVIFHYGSKSKDLVGFTILHLKEFCSMLRKHLNAAHLHQQAWLKRRAMESIYKAISEHKYLNLYQIPKPFWKLGASTHK